MSAHHLRLLDTSELRAAQDLFLGTLHRPPSTDEAWRSAASYYDTSQALGAWEGDRLVGTTTAWPSRLAVPGGATVSGAAISRVGVRADRTRRGVLTALLRTQLTQLREQGTTAATLRATEAVIYGRFGFGVATRGRTVAVDRGRAALHGHAPAGGEVRLLDADGFTSVLPTVYAAVGVGRAGWIERWPGWWNRAARAQPDETRVAAVHTGPHGDDGFVVYGVRRGHGHGEKSVLTVHDLVAGSPQALAGLWRFLLRIDLVDEVVAELRPLDEPVELLLANRRACQVRSVDDETWLRLLHVPDALAARTYGEADPVVIEVADTLLPANRGHYRISPDGAKPTDEPAQLAMDVATLAAVYLGDVQPSTLAAAGLVEVADPAALPLADRLFATGQVPWSGTYF